MLKKTNKPTHDDRWTEKLAPILLGAGFQIVWLQVISGRERKLRVFIERRDGSPVTIDDCAKASRALDLTLDHDSEVDDIFKGSYELEVSSPGLDRPLRKPEDFVRFKGQRARIHLFRPLTEEEAGDYARKNPKQKSFSGILEGVWTGVGNGCDGTYVGLRVQEKVSIRFPLGVISKANLDPDFKASEKV